MRHCLRGERGRRVWRSLHSLRMCNMQSRPQLERDLFAAVPGTVLAAQCFVAPVRMNFES